MIDFKALEILRLISILLNYKENEFLDTICLVIKPDK